MMACKERSAGKYKEGQKVSEPVGKARGAAAERAGCAGGASDGPLYDNFRYEVRDAVRAKIDIRGRSAGGGSGFRRETALGSEPDRNATSGRLRVALVERFAGTERVVGYAEGWRAAALKMIDEHFAEKGGRERGFRLFLALKSLRTVDARRGAEMLDALKKMTLEETIFWVWQYHSYGDRAIGAMKHIHMSESARRRKFSYEEGSVNALSFGVN